MSTRKTTLFYAVLIALASVAVGMVIASRLDLSPTSSAQPVNVPASNSAPLTGPIDASTFKNIAKAQIPMVVNIQTEARARTREMTEFGGGGDEMLRRFFGQPEQPGQPQRRAPRRNPRDEEGQVTQSAGTGFVIDKTGFILTNNHVVEGADVIRVSLFGGGRTESYAAKVVGRDPLTDSALIQLTEMPSVPLQEAKFGDSSLMEPGDWVMAIGNPFSLGHTVTVGVISALGREFATVSRGREQPMLQTDAAINPGNSGGPLLNIRGEVVGMNTAIYTSQQQSSNIGIGFATPINTLRDLVPQLRAGKITRGRIGVFVDRTFTKQAAEALGVTGGGGALISQVSPGGAAAKAGVQPGDVVIEFNGRPVADNEQLVAMVVATKPGVTVPMTIVRDRQRKTLNVTIDELDLVAEAGGRRSRDTEQPDAEPTETGFGMTVAPVTPDVARETELPRNRGGAVVTDVDRNSPAANAGVSPGDIILEVNRQAVSNPGQITRALQSAAPGKPVFLLVWRNGSEAFVTLSKR
ncbi:MAG TPA: trypsin-like peptidase domain-containing protein [Vicinamibacterales bacterium]|nr:trypsin-like peptidase domain-containing protein [Vicinamibacterales bacterium]